MAERRHRAQVQQVQRQARVPHESGPVPADLSALYAAIAALQGSSSSTGENPAAVEQEAVEEPPGVEALIAAI